MAIVGSGMYRYEVQADWGKLPQGYEWGQVGAVGIDSQDRVYVFNRSSHPMMIFDRDGNLLSTWGEGQIKQAHGIYIGNDDSMFIVDRDAHVVMKCTLDGKVLFTMGNRDKPSDTGFTTESPTVKRAAGPFNLPTDVGMSSHGEIYVSDGYRNARVHKFSADGKLLFSWGEPGTGPGQFNLVHSVWEARNGRVYVADRQNGRIQVFTPNGKYIEHWDGYKQPCKIYVDRNDIMYVAELGSRLTICNLDGTIFTRIEGNGKREPGQPLSPHGVWVDSRGDMYVAEVLQSARLQKFIRQR
ncbi:MAG: hypothetical protein HY681_13015 [Chloroflexi bacterium]|nr:hypothetical protein [Chloroflexota bacterium]